MTEIDKIISDAKEYIDDSAKHASDAFKLSNMTFEFFEGTKIELSPELCRSIYVDMLRSMLENQHSICQKFCLTAVMLPLTQPDNSVTLSIQLGIVWPNDKSGE